MSTRATSRDTADGGQHGCWHGAESSRTTPAEGSLQSRSDPGRADFPVEVLPLATLSGPQGDDEGSGVVEDAIAAQPAVPSPSRDVGRPGDAADVTGLAATLAALDPQLTAWRNDVLVSAIVEVLSRKSHLSAKELKAELQTLWVSRSTTLSAVRDGLQQAEEAGLVHQTRRPAGEVRWQVTAEAKEEAQAYRARAQRLLEELKGGVAARLTELLPDPLPEERVARLTRSLVKAMASASERVFEGVRASRSPADIKDVRYNLRGLAEQLRHTVTPPAHAEALVRIAVAAADPMDDFGNEFLHVIVSGQVLHGMLSRQDMAPGPAVAGTLLVLDTSFLVMSVEQDDRISETFDALLRESMEAGCRVVVTRDVLGEWERMWKRADEEEPEALVGLAPASLTRLLRSPLLRSYAAAHEATGMKWRTFCGRYRPIEQRLTDAGVEVSQETPPADVAERVQAELLRLSHEHPEFRGRTAATAAVDAASAAHVAAARRAGTLANGLPSAWFLGREWLTGQAYRNVQSSDHFPLTVSAQSWLLFMSASTGHDASSPALAEILSETVILDSFLTVATGYSAEDIVHIAGSLDAKDIDNALAVEMIRARLDADPEDSEHAALRAAELIRRRAQTRSRTAQAEVRAAQDQAAAADARAIAAEAQAEEARADAARAAAAPPPAPPPAPAPDDTATLQWKRLAIVVSAVSAYVVVLVILKYPVDASRFVLWPAYFGLAVVIFEGVRFTDPDVRARRFIGTVIASILYMVGSTVGGYLITEATKPSPQQSSEPDATEPAGPPDQSAASGTKKSEPSPEPAQTPHIDLTPAPADPAALPSASLPSILTLKARPRVTDHHVGTPSLS